MDIIKGPLLCTRQMLVLASAVLKPEALALSGMLLEMQFGVPGWPRS